MELFITAFTIGLVGSLHCIGMCGPIALALPLGNKSALAKITNGLVYNFGRIFTYSFFGLFFGFFGERIALASTQQNLSIVVGSLFILSVFIPKKITNKLEVSGWLGGFISQLKQRLGKLIHATSLSSKFLVGVLNGLLPCGLVYAAIGGSISTSNPFTGALFMCCFGLGTLPMMFSVYFFANAISIELRNNIKKLIPVFLIVLGCLFILRGLNLGIPYLSPKIDVARPFIQDCD
jgi:sulfite exporter TauE/SafE